MHKPVVSSNDGLVRRSSPVAGAPSPSGAPSDSFLLKEDGDYLLLENSKMILDTGSGPPAPDALPVTYSTIEVQNAIYDAFGFWVEAANGDIVFMARRGTTHTFETAGKVRKWISDDDGATWTQSDIADHASYDDRNCAGGIVPATDTIMLFYARYNVAGTAWQDIRILRSTDNGGGLNDLGAIGVGADTGFSPYGPIVELPSGKLMQTFYGDDGADYRCFVQFSSDDGQTWGGTVEIASSGTDEYTECAAAYIDGDTDGTARLVAVSRVNNGVLTQFSSTDGGGSWNNDGELRFSQGQGKDVSPWLLASGGVLYLIWADRNVKHFQYTTATAAAVPGSIKQWAKKISLRKSLASNEIDMGYPSMGLFDGDIQIMLYDVDGANDPDIYHSF